MPSSPLPAAGEVGHGRPAEGASATRTPYVPLTPDPSPATGGPAGLPGSEFGRHCWAGRQWRPMVRHDIWRQTDHYLSWYDVHFRVVFGLGCAAAFDMHFDGMFSDSVRRQSNSDRVQELMPPN